MGVEVIVYRNDQTSLQELAKLKLDRIVISSGSEMPESEKYFGICKTVLQTLSHSIPTLGVCTGHQGIIHAYGGKVVQAKKLMQGKTCRVKHYGKTLFTGVRNPFSATCYHSRVGERSSIPNCLQIIAETVDDGEIMGVQHVKYPIYGVQFHPESVLCQDGKVIIRNFVEGKNL
jgi:anthranilate synthase component 2